MAKAKENQDCIFCKIIAGEIPPYKIYEDDKIIAFLDIAPISPGHALVVPKKHYEFLEDIPNDTLGEIMIAIKKLAPAIIKAVSSKAFNLGLNNGKTAGQLVPHAHFHIMPRFENDGLEFWPGKKYKEGEAEEIAKKIKAELA